jgi:NADPH:quinone reductase-like Zn-dependent oxidoreductase
MTVDEITCRYSVGEAVSFPEKAAPSPTVQYKAIVGQARRLPILRGRAECPPYKRLTDHKFAQYVTAPNEADLKFLGDLMAQGRVKPFVEKTHPIAQTAKALRYFGQGHARGKIVIA